MPPLTPLDVVTLLGVAVAAFLDVRTAVAPDGSLQQGRIPNTLTFGLALFGLGAHVLEGDPLVGLLGFGVAFAVHFPLWVLGVDGAGDAKLMMAVGALWGWRTMLEATCWTYLLFLPLGLLLLGLRGRLPMLVHAISWTVSKARGEDPGPRPPPTYWPRGPVILAGCALAWATSWLGLFSA
jgi:prepilin peptidase CpaA